jgi:hypothetical protein
MMIREVKKSHKPTTLGKELGQKMAYEMCGASYGTELVENLELQYIYCVKLHVNCKLMKQYLDKAKIIQDFKREGQDDSSEDSGRGKPRIVESFHKDFDVNYPF